MASRNTPSDEELVRSAQQGKLEAFTTLYERYLHTVYNRVRYTVPEQDVEDVTQEIFIAVMKSLKGFRCESQFNTWLRTLVIRQIADYYRRKSPLQILVEADSKTNDEEDIYARAEKPDQRANMDESMALRHGLATLPEQYAVQRDCDSQWEIAGGNQVAFPPGSRRTSQAGGANQWLSILNRKSNTWTTSL
jgi:RNA polymerase sigma factor (sigma-70 family)